MVRWIIPTLIWTAICWLIVVIALLPWQVKLRWRKLWQGAVAFKLEIRFTGLGGGIEFNRRSRPIAWLLARMEVMQRRSPTIILRQSRRKLAFAAAIAPAVAISHWAIHAEVGFDDPSLTGECLGLLSAMPSAVQQSIRITFDRVGIRSRGCVSFSIQPLLLFWKIGLWWWTR